MVLHFLRKGSDRFYSGLGHNKLILSTVDCVWSVQLNPKVNLLLFIIKKHPNIGTFYTSHIQNPHADSKDTLVP